MKLLSVYKILSYVDTYSLLRCIFYCLQLFCNYIHYTEYKKFPNKHHAIGLNYMHMINIIEM